MTTPRHVVLGVTASIAIHRALDLTSELRKRGHRVSVVMTPHSQRLVTPLTFQALSLSKVFHDMWELTEDFNHDHIRLAQDCDAFLLAPASAGTIGKLAHGILDNILTTTAFACGGARLFAPAMNWRMWGQRAVQENCRRLQEDGWEMIPPESGDLACGEKGPGRLAAVPRILERLTARLESP